MTKMLRVFEAQPLADECDVSQCLNYRPEGTSTLHHFKSSKCPRFGSKRPHSITADYSFVIVLRHGREYGQNLRQKGPSTVLMRRWTGRTRGTRWAYGNLLDRPGPRDLQDPLGLRASVDRPDPRDLQDPLGLRDLLDRSDPRGLRV